MGGAAVDEGDSLVSDFDTAGRGQRDLASVNAGVRVVRRANRQDGGAFRGARCGTMQTTETGFSGSGAGFGSGRVMACDGRREEPQIRQGAGTSPPE